MQGRDVSVDQLVEEQLAAFVARYRTAHAHLPASPSSNRQRRQPG
jgi:hypothetical protein